MKKKKNKSKPALPVVLLIFVAGLTLSGCGNGQKAVPSDAKKSTITIWAWDETFNIKAAKMAEEIYEKEHEDIEIVIETMEHEEILASVKNMLSTKVYDDLPDVIMMEDYDAQAVLASYADEFVDLTDAIDSGRFIDYKTQVCSRDGRLYGIPFDSGTAALFYRLDVIEAAGFTEADMQNLTWTKFIQIGQKVLKETGMPMITLDPTDLPLLRIIMQSAGRWYVKEDGSTPDITENTALREGIEIYTELLKNDIGMSVGSWNEFISAFQTGQVACVISGAWIISSMKQSTDQEGLWRIANIPVAEGDSDMVPASSVGGSAWYILQNGKNTEKATEFMVEMFGQNDAFIDSLIGQIGLIPALTDITQFSAYEARDPFFGGQKVTKFLTDLGADIPVVNYGSKTYEIEGIVTGELQNILNDYRLDECLERLEQKVAAVARE